MSEPTETPIIVHATPTRAQLEAGIRQVLAALGIILAALGMTAWADKLGVVVNLAPQIAVILTVVGPVIWGACVWLGQLFTRRQAKKLAITASAAPDSVAVVKAP